MDEVGGIVAVSMDIREVGKLVLCYLCLGVKRVGGNVCVARFRPFLHFQGGYGDEREL